MFFLGFIKDRSAVDNTGNEWYSIGKMKFLNVVPSLNRNHQGDVNPAILGSLRALGYCAMVTFQGHLRKNAEKHVKS